MSERFKYLRKSVSHFSFFTVCGLGWLSVFPGIASAAPEPGQYLGAATCASSNCHGGVAPRSASSVLQNEYVTWQKKDKHSGAWQILLNEESKTIAKHLDIPAAEKEPLCLKCHATFVDSKLHGDKFRVEDGVSCESCHGASEHWLKTHTERDATHEKNLELGLKDIVSPAARAALCLECHYGTDDKTVNHRLIGAGHPRLNFELDTFGTLQPKHWETDEDYVKRKGAYEPARAWLVGQTELAIQSMAKLQSPERSKFGAMPELTLFNCYNCHHDLTEDQWKRRNYGGHPGELKLNLSSLEMVQQAMEVLDASTASELVKATSAVEDAFRNGSGNEVAAEASKLLRGKVLGIANKAGLGPDRLQALLKQNLEFGAGSKWLPYETAEQVAMGVASILAQKSPDGRAFRDEVNGLFKSLGNPDQFKPEQFTQACEDFLKRL